jgi:hypothetical protein
MLVNSRVRPSARQEERVLVETDEADLVCRRGQRQTINKCVLLKKLCGVSFTNELEIPTASNNPRTVVQFGRRC